jgi:hypothetical protein
MKKLTFALLTLLLTSCSAYSKEHLLPLKVKSSLESYLEPGGTHVYNLTINGGEAYIVRVETFGRGSRFECFLYDSEDNQLVKGDPGLFTCTIRIESKTTSTYNFVLKNPESKGSSYQVDAL